MRTQADAPPAAEKTVKAGTLLRRLVHLLRGAPRARARIGRYTIVRHLAEGGMGEIFLAHAVGLRDFEKLVVLKRIRPQNMADREAVRMFLDEARLLATLNHPNIVQVHDFGTSGGTPFFTMEYVHGEDLGHLLREAASKGKPLPLEVSIGIIAETAAGLHHAHGKRGKDGQPLQIVHRDVSPSNVLISYDGAVKVADFGIAKWTKREAETRYGALKGKIAYMSPEQCRAEELDCRSDIFCLGILLFELVTGTRLYQGTSDFAVLQEIVTRDAPVPSSLQPLCPPAIDQIVRRALARDPAQRFTSAQQMQLALEDFAREQRLPISAVTRATQMEAMFGDKIGAWRQAVQSGRSLSEHLATQDDLPLAATQDAVPDGRKQVGGARRGTMQERPGVDWRGAAPLTVIPDPLPRTRIAKAGVIVLVFGAIAAGVLMYQADKRATSARENTIGERLPARRMQPRILPLPAPAGTPVTPASMEGDLPATHTRRTKTHSATGLIGPGIPAQTTPHPAQSPPASSGQAAASPPATTAPKYDPDSIFLPH